jgi:uncharacterized protein YjdB
MKKTFLLVVIIAVVGMLYGEIVYVDFSPDSVVQMRKDLERNRVPITMGSSITPQYNFRYDDWRKPPQNGTEWFWHLSFSGNNLDMMLKGTATNPFGGRYLDPLTKGTAIGPGANWGKSFPEPFVGDVYDPNFMGLGDRYAGVRFQENGFNYYGWILLNLDANQTLTVKGFAYENVANATINAGDTAGGAPPILVNTLSIYGANGIMSIPILGNTLQMVADITPLSASNRRLTWSVTDLTGRASIDSNGLLTGLYPGRVSVSAVTKDGTNIMADTIIDIYGKIFPVTSITVRGQGGQTGISTPNGTLQMEFDILPTIATDKTVTWQVFNESGKASITPTGEVTALQSGKVTVQAVANDGSGVTGSTRLTLTNQPLLVCSISLSTATGGKTITDPGGTLQLRASILPALAGNKSVQWVVENMDGMASVSQDGLLQAKADGKVRVRAYALDASGVFSDPSPTVSVERLALLPENGPERILVGAGAGSLSGTGSIESTNMLAASRSAASTSKLVWERFPFASTLKVPVDTGLPSTMTQPS